MKTRKHILDATRRIIQEKGLARVTTREIAREAGCAEGTLYKHFVTKEDLFLAVIQEQLPDFTKIAHIERAGTGTIQTIMTEIILASSSYYEQVLPLLLPYFAATDLLSRHQTWMCERQIDPQHFCKHIAAYIAAEQRLGRIKAHLDPLHTASLLLGPCFQHVFTKLFMGEKLMPMTDQQFAAGLAQTLSKSLSPDTQNRQ